MTRALITGGAGFLGSHLADLFLARGHEVICMDNFITGSPKNIAHLFGRDGFTFVKHDVTYCSDAYETAEGADALVIATEWNEFRALKLERIRKALRDPLIVDLRNVYDPKRMKAEGFRYVCVGRAAGIRPKEPAAS